MPSLAVPSTSTSRPTTLNLYHTCISTKGDIPILQPVLRIDQIERRPLGLFKHLRTLSESLRRHCLVPLLAHPRLHWILDHFQQGPTPFARRRRMGERDGPRWGALCIIVLPINPTSLDNVDASPADIIALGDNKCARRDALVSSGLV